MRQRRRRIAFLNAGFSLAVSERALIRSVILRGSLTQDGTSPQRMSLNRRAPFSTITTGTGCVGAILCRGGKFGCSAYPNTCRIAAGGEVMTKRPHILMLK